jgi:hypothetical protein
MGLLSGMTSGLYRQTIDGRRIYQLPSVGPRRRWPAYLVSDEDAKRVEARLRRVLLIVLPGLISLMVLALPREASIRYWIGVVIVPLVVTRALQRLWVLRGIPRVAVTESELEPLDKRARQMIQLRAIGTPALLAMIVAGVAMTTLQVVGLIQDKYWLAGLGTVLFAGLTIVLTHRLFLLRRDRCSAVG